MRLWTGMSGTFEKAWKNDAIGATSAGRRKEGFPWILHPKFRTTQHLWLGKASLTLDQNIQSKCELNHCFSNQRCRLEIS
jgi:hypothetical protein